MLETYWSSPLLRKEQGKDEKVKFTMLVPFWQRGEKKLGFYLFSASQVSSFWLSGKEKCLEWSDLLEEILLQWLTAQGASGWLFASNRRRNVMELNAFVEAKQCTHINLSHIGKLCHTSPSLLCGTSMYSNMGIWACKFCSVLWPPRTK